MNGGLGNQVFQYIFARYIEETTKTRVLIDDHVFFMTKDDTLNRAPNMPGVAGQTRHNGYEIDYVFPHARPSLLSDFFDPDVWRRLVAKAKESNGGMANIAQQLLDTGIDLTMVVEAADPRTLAFTGTKLMTTGNRFNSSVIQVPENTYFYGYWINPGWFNSYRDIFREELSFRPIEDRRNKEYENEIRGSLSIGVHIRRGDFVLRDWAVPESCYFEAVTELKNLFPGAAWFVFSDDIEWCKSNIVQLGLSKKSTVFVEGNYDFRNNYIDLQLMTMCKVLVVGASSFSYLACILNETPDFTAILTRDALLEDIQMKPTDYRRFKFQ